MTERTPLDDLAIDAYDALCAELENLRLAVAGHDAVSQTWARKLREAEAELEETRALLHDANGDRDSWYREAKTAEAEVDQLRVQRHTYRRAWNSAKNRARKERARAEQAEAKLAAFLLAALDEHQEQPPAAPPAHIGGRANAEDCPACAGTNPPYPFICPGP
ncbi:hypothetical protein [Streptomyces sp. NPDC056543]|uniref:hypothetical protein n=1 Tax=unclassified Streptomyces TaxID=2593676 RepID=UPI00367CD1F2